MCTAISLKTKDRYFGRNLDLDRSFGEEIVVMPRAYPLVFRKMGDMTPHYAIIGMATVVDGTPLYYDAVNEHGLAMAGLNFPGNAYYAPICEEKDNIASFELILWLLGQCKTTDEAKDLLASINLCDIPFADTLPTSPLHFMISDGKEDIVLEAMRDGMHIYDNPVGVLTNNPPFPYHLENLEKYKTLRNDNRGIARNTALPYSDYCQGLGAVGLPGDVSSKSRFVRAAFGRTYSACEAGEEASVGQFFHLLDTVAMTRGTCKTDEGTWDITVYSSCMNLDRGLYYYKTYDNSRISCVDMHHTDLLGASLSRYPLHRVQDILLQN